AARLKSDFAEAHCNLGLALRDQGEFAEALESLQRGHELGSKKKPWSYPSATWVRQCERLLGLDKRLAGVLENRTKDISPRERIDFAILCQRYKGLHVAATRLYAEAFDAEPKLAENLRASHRYDAACSAALAAAKKGKDALHLDDVERAKLRTQCHTWLRADLDARRKVLSSTPVSAFIL